MKSNKNRSVSGFSFLVSAVVSAAAAAAALYYIPFSNETAGSYFVAEIFGDPLKIFLIKILSVAASLIAFIVFIVKSRRKACAKPLFPGFLIAFGVIWMALPLLSSYVLSRFTGSLIIQTVSGIAEIANAVFMMLSVCFAGICVIDLAHCILMLCERKRRADCLAFFLCGIPFGISCAVFISSALQATAGLSSIFVLLGAAASVIGIFSLFFNGFKNNSEDA